MMRAPLLELRAFSQNQNSVVGGHSCVIEVHQRWGEECCNGVSTSRSGLLIEYCSAVSYSQSVYLQFLYNAANLGGLSHSLWSIRRTNFSISMFSAHFQFECCGVKDYRNYHYSYFTTKHSDTPELGIGSSDILPVPKSCCNSVGLQEYGDRCGTDRDFHDTNRLLHRTHLHQRVRRGLVLEDWDVLRKCGCQYGEGQRWRDLWDDERNTFRADRVSKSFYQWL